MVTKANPWVMGTLPARTTVDRCSASQSADATGQPTRKGVAILARVDDSDVVRDLGRWGRHIPASVRQRALECAHRQERLYQVKLYVCPYTSLAPAVGKVKGGAQTS